MDGHQVSTGVVAYSAGTSAFGAGVSVILVWLITVIFHVTVPNEVAMAFVVVLTTLTSFVLRYLPQPAQRQPNEENGSKS